MRIQLLSVMILLVPGSALLTGQTDQPAMTKVDSSGPKPQPHIGTLAETTHTLRIESTSLSYKATAGHMAIFDENEKITAKIFFIAYTRSDVANVSNRPVTFTFNGGPGSSSVWLHLGGLGPKRVLCGENGEQLPPPYRLVDNEGSILDATDLVFIDPVSTGFSKVPEGRNAKDHHGLQEDLNSVAEFIRLYLTRYKRWGSPKFLAGESYGTTRAAGLSSVLHDQYGITLNGVILISVALNFQTFLFAEGNDLPYSLYLPSYTATAWYHKKLPTELQQDFKKALNEAEQFAEGEYSQALMRGNALSEVEKQAIARKVARLTGLSEDYVLRCHLRVEYSRFMKELLRDRKRTVGRFDSRFLGTDSDANGATSEYDPSFPIVLGPYTQTLNDYVRSELKVENDSNYEILSGKVQPWKWNTENRYANLAANLRRAMMMNPYLNVYVANGYYDLATPYFAADYTFKHLAFDPLIAQRITTSYYDAGHMMYIHKPSLLKMRKELLAFIQGAIQPRAQKEISQNPQPKAPYR